MSSYLHLHNNLSAPPPPMPKSHKLWKGGSGGWKGKGGKGHTPMRWQQPWLFPYPPYYERPEVVYVTTEEEFMQDKPKKLKEEYKGYILESSAKDLEKDNFGNVTRIWKIKDSSGKFLVALPFEAAIQYIDELIAKYEQKLSGLDWKFVRRKQKQLPYGQISRKFFKGSIRGGLSPFGIGELSETKKRSVISKAMSKKIVQKKPISIKEKLRLFREKQAKLKVLLNKKILELRKQKEIEKKSIRKSLSPEEFARWAVDPVEQKKFREKWLEIEAKELAKIQNTQMSGFGLSIEPSNWRAKTPEQAIKKMTRGEMSSWGYKAYLYALKGARLSELDVILLKLAHKRGNLPAIVKHIPKVNRYLSYEVSEEGQTAFQRLFLFLNEHPEVLKYLSENESARNLVFGHPERIEKMIEILQRLGITKKKVVEPYKVQDIPPYVWVGGGLFLFLLLSRR